MTLKNPSLVPLLLPPELDLLALKGPRVPLSPSSLLNKLLRAGVAVGTHLNGLRRLQTEAAMSGAFPAHTQTMTAH